eukprot:CAMPEP_0175106334 /NCGR_PEP_ID=MMETSP0086_2-20121207/11120_1 /TAXON_ID=136419 /ORGANISM="Unknown Unknown, Strain D1" /LENGTH=40 /DNA_ID= /DNA_START= /DNA_END= /DNA_ORIENTATION=
MPSKRQKLTHEVLDALDEVKDTIPDGTYKTTAAAAAAAAA